MAKAKPAPRRFVTLTVRIPMLKEDRPSDVEKYVRSALRNWHSIREILDKYGEDTLVITRAKVGDEVK